MAVLQRWQTLGSPHPDLGTLISSFMPSKNGSNATW
ncbi:hypothetical protein ACHAXN_002019 [Cyclotella atomus]